MGQQLLTNTFGVAKWIVSSTLSDGTHTTLPAALASASSGDTIFIRPGTYTGDYTLKAGVNICAFDCDALTPNVTLIGKMTATFSGSVTLSGLRFQSNSDNIFEASGSNPTIVTFKSCYFNVTSSTAIVSSVNNGSSFIFIDDCKGEINAIGAKYFALSNLNTTHIIYSTLSNSASSVTPNTLANGCILGIFDTQIALAITTSDNALFTSIGTQFTQALILNGINTNNFEDCYFSTGVDSAITIGAGVTATVTQSQVDTSNVAAIAGAGTIQFASLTFNNSSSITTTTQVILTSGPDVVTKTLNTRRTAADTLLLRAYDVDGASYTTFATLTANNTPTMDLSDSVTKAGGYIYRAGGTPVAATDGGTGQSTYATGDILYASGVNTLAKLAASTDGKVLTLASGIPSWASASGGTVTSVSGTANRITSTGGTTPVIDIAATYVGQTSLTTLGTIATGVWNGTTIAVANGGTGATSLTAHSILLGQGTSAVTALGAATNGQLPIGSTGADPVLATLTQGTGISITNGAGSITIAAATGVATTYTEDSGTATPSSNNLNVLGSGSIATSGSGATITTALTGLTNHNVLVGAGTSTITKVAPSATSGVPLISQGASADPVFGTAVVAGGGTGATSLTAHSLLLGQGTSAVTALGAATNGQLPIGSTGADPVLATLTQGTGISITNGAGSITIAATATGLTWSVVTVNATFTVNTGTIANKSGLLTMTLPTTSAVGDILEITGINTAVGWRIAQNANQIVHFGTSVTTTGTSGYVEATNIRDSVRMVCVVANLEWNVLSSIGNMTVN